MQTIRIQAVGRIVRRHHEPDIQLEQPGKQPVQDHRVGDISDMKFIADQAVAGRDAFGDFIERIFSALSSSSRWTLRMNS